MTVEVLERWTYRVASDLAPAIRDGLKTATVRYADERRPTPRDRIQFETPDDERVSTGRITAVVEVPVSQAVWVIDTLGAGHAAENTQELLTQLNQHYETFITPETQVRVLIWTGAEANR